MATEHFGEANTDTELLKAARLQRNPPPAALWYIFNMMQLKDSNLLVVRLVENTHRNPQLSLF